MGLLSKIFNTNKLEYILTEKTDDFTVDAPESWNIEYLTVGDKITPDMFKDQYRFYDFDLYIKEIGYDDEYEYDDDMEGDFYVTTEFDDSAKKYLHNQHTWWFHEINDYLKPEYKVVQPLSESEADDFTVDAPQQWNVETLTVGDTITPEMFKDQYRHYDFNFTITEIGFEEVDYDYDEDDEENGSYYVVTKFDPKGKYLHDEFTWGLNELNSYLKPEYKVVSSDLKESEEDFNVVSPKEWNIEYLSVEDTITPDMWSKKKTMGLLHTNIDFFETYKISKINLVDWWYDGEDRHETVEVELIDSQRKPLIIMLENINMWLKDEFKVVSPDLKESEEDFSVDAPQGWNVIELGVGDYIYPEMIKVPKDKRKWNHFHNMLADPKRTDGWKIVGFKTYDGRDLVRLEYNGVGNFFNVDELNSILKQYRIFFPTNETKLSSLLEQDDEFSVDAPKEWNVEHLTVGDTITPNMWDEQKFINGGFSLKTYNGVIQDSYLIKNMQYDEGGYDGAGADWLVDLRLVNTNKNFGIIGTPEELSLLNSLLKDKYKIYPNNINESEDEFNIVAPNEWNIETLTVGDTITPDMWDQSKLGRTKDYFEKPIKIYWIGYNEFDDEEQELLVGLDLGGEIDYQIDFINNLLKPEYKIVSPGLNESEDEFNVDAPSEWNAPDLKIGSIITPDMWNDEVKELSSIHQFKTALTTPLIIKTIYPQNIGGSPGLLMFFTNGTYIHSSFLKPQYQIIPNLSENEDEFTVDAPEDWNVEELGIGSILDPSNLRMQDYSKKYEIIDFRKTPWGTDVITKVFKLIEEPIPGARRTTRQWKYLRNSNMDLKTLNGRLKDNFKIISPLNESDEEFIVKAPENWNITELEVGDTIKGKMWDWKKIINYCNRISGDNHEELNNAINLWKQVYDEGVTIESINEFEEIPWIKFNRFLTWGPSIYTINTLLSNEYKISNLPLSEEAEDFMVTAPKEWDVIELGVGDYINSNMLNPKGNHYTWFSRRKLFIEDIYFDECWTTKLLHVESNFHVEFCIDYMNEDVLNDKYKIMNSLNELSKLLEVDDEFSVDAPEEWNVQELGIGDKITRDMIKNPVFLDQMDEDFRIDFPGVITNMYRAGVPGDEFWGVRIKFQDVGWRKYLPKSKDIKLGLGFTLDGFNKNTLKPQYQIKKPIFELSSLLENEDDFNVNAPDEWNVEFLTVGDTITPEMWGVEKINNWFDISKPLNIEDIGEDDGGWWIQLGRSEAPFDLDEVNEFLKPQYKIIPYNLKESNDEFTVDAPEEWNDEYWEPTGGIDDENYINSFDEFARNVLKKHGIEDEVIESYLDEIYHFGEISSYEGISSSELIKDFSLWTEAENDDDQWYDAINEEDNLDKSDDEFTVDAPEEWNITQLGVNDVITPDMWSKKRIKTSLIINKIEKRGIIDGNEWWEVHMRPYGFKFLRNNEKSSIIVDLNDVQNHLKPEYKIIKSNVIFEEEDEFTVGAPKKWNVKTLELGDYINIHTNQVYYNEEDIPEKERSHTCKIDYIGPNDENNKYFDYHLYDNNVVVLKNVKSRVWYTFAIKFFNKEYGPRLNAYVDYPEKGTLNEQDEFNVIAPEGWWEYDGDVEIMFQDTYWYEDENGKEAAVERDGGGIININDLEQYSYSDWKPFTGNPTNENLTKWWYSIGWDYDLVEIFDFDDSIFEVEEDFEWSTAENIDMDRTYFRIRAVSTLKETDDEFTVKAPKKWDVIYLNTGDFLDNTNSTFDNPNVKYEIGNITSDGEIEVKKYINRGEGFEPQFNRFMKTRKGIVKAKLKPGFDIEISSK